MTVQQWLAVLLAGVVLDGGAVSALSSECFRLYSKPLAAAGKDGYDINKLVAQYVAAWLAPVTIDGAAGTMRTVTETREGKVWKSYGGAAATKSGWLGTTWGQDFNNVMSLYIGGSGCQVGHAS